MSIIDQCPSTKTKGVEPDHEAAAPTATSGKTYWRSLDDLAKTKDFRDFLEREFPAYASELLDGSRRHFLKIMGASLALAGVAAVPGCRRPDHKILPYNTAPEEIIPGKPLYYATAMPTPGGGAEGLLAETFEGRPTKLEGNPLHPYNRGTLGSRTQAQILSLYDPDRDPQTAEELARDAGQELTVARWSQARATLADRFASFDANGGTGLAFLVDKVTSPARDRMRDTILKRWPNAQWLAYDACDNEAEQAGLTAALGSPHRLRHAFDKADVVLSLDADFLGSADARLDDIRGWANHRIREGHADHAAHDTTMSRLYVGEASMTLTGGQADHRLALSPDAVTALALQVAHEVLRLTGGSSQLKTALDTMFAQVTTYHIDTAWIEAVAADLVAAKGRSLVVAGPTQPAGVHALVLALNQVLGNLGQTVKAIRIGGDIAQSSTASIQAINAGSIQTLVTIGCNPVFTAPADLNFADTYANIPTTIHLGDHDETALASTLHIGRSHFLEAWGDAATLDGEYSIVQPMIKPLYDTAGDLEFLATIAGQSTTDAYDITRAAFAQRARTAGAALDKAWRRALHDGFTSSSAGQQAAGGANPSGVANAVAGLAGLLARHNTDGITLVYSACERMRDAAMANNGWLVEQPGTIHKVSWDNPALISMKTARDLGLKTGRHLEGPQYNHVQVAKVTSGGRSIEVPVLVQPGLADNVLVLHMGWGRRVCGRIGRNTGFDVFSLRDSVAMKTGVDRNATVERAKRSPYMLANTQDHWSMEGRSIVPDADLEHWHHHGDTDFAAGHKDAYSVQRDTHKYAEQFGVEAHAPVNEHVYNKPGRRGGALEYRKTDAEGNEVLDAQGRPLPAENKYGKPIPQWGMTIDLTRCIGCAACSTACQAENNIPIVGKVEVAKGREMHWIRVDRYYASYKMEAADFDHPQVSVQPVACVHCEAAPCEVVCPVNATVHSDTGLNTMAYNRCIGTRYCSNNCPYKVRRFNYFDYATKQYKGGFGQLADGAPDALAPGNENFIPPRLREPIAEVSKMQHNPNVTVRSRGVMEKCTYCIQRINAASVETKVADLDHIPDGFFQVACQQACPANAIEFGNIYDYDANDGKGSKVYQSRQSGRAYALLAYLNTRPRTSYLMRLRNANVDLLKAQAAHGDEHAKQRLEHEVEHPFHMHDGHGHADHHGELPGGPEGRTFGPDIDHDDPAHEGGGHTRGRIMSLPVLGQGVIA